MGSPRGVTWVLSWTAGLALPGEELPTVFLRFSLPSTTAVTPSPDASSLLLLPLGGPWAQSSCTWQKWRPRRDGPQTDFRSDSQADRAIPAELSHEEYQMGKAQRGVRIRLRLKLSSIVCGHINFLLLFPHLHIGVIDHHSPGASTRGSIRRPQSALSRRVLLSSHAFGEVEGACVKEDASTAHPGQ